MHAARSTYHPGGQVERRHAGVVQGKAALPGKPKQMAVYAREIRAAGARVIGACCGSTPAHLKAMAEALAGTEA